MNVLAGVEAYLTRHGFDSLGSVIGAALSPHRETQ